MSSPKDQDGNPDAENVSGPESQPKAVDVVNESVKGNCFIWNEQVDPSVIRTESALENQASKNSVQNENCFTTGLSNTIPSHPNKATWHLSDGCWIVIAGFKVIVPLTAGLCVIEHFALSGGVSIVFADKHTVVPKLYRQESVQVDPGTILGTSVWSRANDISAVCEHDGSGISRGTLIGSDCAQDCRSNTQVP